VFLWKPREGAATCGWAWVVMGESFLLARLEELVLASKSYKT
jgi:hypothetical protein